MFVFPKKYRLASKKDYDYVFAESNKTLCREFIVLHRKSCFEHARLGLIVSKRKVSKANQRNRLKRILRESFRIQALPAVDIIFLARHGAEKVESAVINAHLGIVWKKLAKFYPEL